MFKTKGGSLNFITQLSSYTLPNMPIMAKYAKYGIWGAYLGAPNMVKWDVPGKILQNTVKLNF